jgi:hypothetical protein
MALLNTPVYLMPNRLSDVLRAIQVMGADQYYCRTINEWTSGLGDPMSATSWDKVFWEHPEFFGSGRNKHGVMEYWLRLRRAQKNSQNLPLDSSQMETLLKTAIDLNVRASELSLTLPKVVNILGSIVVPFIGAWAGAHFKN